MKIECIESKVSGVSPAGSDYDVALYGIGYRGDVYLPCDETNVLNIEAVPYEDLRIFEVFAKIGSSGLQYETNYICPQIEAAGAFEWFGHKKQQIYKELCHSYETEKVKLLKAILRKQEV